MPQYFCRQPNGLYASFDTTINDFEVQDLTSWEAFACTFEHMGRADAERKVIRAVRDLPLQVVSLEGQRGSGTDRWAGALSDIHDPVVRERRREIGEAPVESFEDSRALDVEVERVVFGHPEVVLDEDGYSARWEDLYVYHYSTFEVDTFEVINNLRERGYRFSCMLPAKGEAGIVRASFIGVGKLSPEAVFGCNGETFPGAVCRAALSVLGAL